MILTRSIRWRLQIWLTFLLASILSGFGVTAYQLHRTNHLAPIDEGLSRRLAAVSKDIRGRGPFGPPHGFGPFEREGGRMGLEWGQGPRRHPPPEGGGPAPWHPSGPEMMAPAARPEFRP